MSFEPKILAFCCNWCSYAAADLAGINRLQYPDSIRIIRVMCSGMIHPEMVLHAFNRGADGVMIIGCHLGECHYQEGNYKALSRAEIITDIIEDFGYERERFALTWVSSAEPDRFTEAVTDMAQRIQELGPNPIAAVPIATPEGR
jgi:F420-non-reducing hydrogenase iron-sulfur subunit